MSAAASLPDRFAGAERYAAGDTFTEGLAPGEVLEGIEFEGCRFDGAVLEGAVLRGCTFTECVFTACNLNRVDLDGSRFTDCTFVDCTALAVTWTRAAVAPLSARPWDFERCRLDLASFQEAAMAGSRLVDCSLREADFGGADAQGVDLGGSGLAGAVFVGTDLRAASLLGATGYVFDPSENRVRGLRLDASRGDGAARGDGGRRRVAVVPTFPPDPGTFTFATEHCGGEGEASGVEHRCSTPVAQPRVGDVGSTSSSTPSTSRENPRPTWSPSRCSTCTQTPVCTSRATR